MFDIKVVTTKFSVAGDGFGSICDGDLDNDDIVGFSDVPICRASLGQ